MKFAGSLLSEVLPKPFAGELFLAGGAFKPLIKPGHPVRDLDLWVRDRRTREHLAGHLLAGGAELVRDFAPYCMNFRCGERQVEITYQNVKDRPISEIVEGFDIAACAIAATYQGGRVTDCYVSPRALSSTQDKQVMLTEGYVGKLRASHTPDLLQSIDRLSRFADELDFELARDVRERLWSLYEHEYSDEERQACIDTYLAATVDYKGRCNLDILRRANESSGARESEALIS